MNTAKKVTHDQTPESYSPKVKPKIMNLAKQVKKEDVTLLATEAINPAMKTFETERLIIRRFTPGDWAEIQKLAINKESSEYAMYDHEWPTSEDDCRNSAEYFSGSDSYWAVCLKPQGRMVGFIAFNGIDEKRSLDIGHIFNTEFGGNNYDTEAIECMIHYAFEELDVSSIIANNAAEWKAQLAPLEKLGMKVVNLGKGSIRENPDGIPFEFIGCKMKMTKNEWYKTHRSKTGNS